MKKVRLHLKDGYKVVGIVEEQPFTPFNYPVITIVKRNGWKETYAMTQIKRIEQLTEK